MFVDEENIVVNNVNVDGKPKIMHNNSNFYWKTTPLK